LAGAGVNQATGRQLAIAGLEEKEIGYYNFENYSLISKFCRKNKQLMYVCQNKLRSKAL
jgi:hypothetical protein